MAEDRISVMGAKDIMVGAVEETFGEIFFVGSVFAHIGPHIDCAICGRKTAAAPMDPAPRGAVTGRIKPALITCHHFINESVITVNGSCCEAPKIAFCYNRAVNFIDAPVVSGLSGNLPGTS